MREEHVPDWVIAAFGAEGTPEPLDGGQGRSWRVGDLVMKRVDDRREAAFIQEILDVIQPRGFRISEPRRTTDGRWVIDGWAASAWITDLRSGIGRWADVVAAGTAFTDRVRLICPPTAAASLSERSHRWAVADQVAWSERDVTLGERGDELVAAMRAAVIEREDDSGITESPSTLIHGDLTGNVFFDAQDVAVVLDFSPYLRPAAFAPAMALADALAWHDAPSDVIGELVSTVAHAERRRLDDDDDRPAVHLARALLGRAFIFRMVAMLLAGLEGPTPHAADDVIDRYRSLADAHL